MYIRQRMPSLWKWREQKKKTQLKSFKLGNVEALFSQTHTISPMNLYTNTLMSDTNENSFT